MEEKSEVTKVTIHEEHSFSPCNYLQQFATAILKCLGLNSEPVPDSSADAGGGASSQGAADPPTAVPAADPQPMAATFRVRRPPPPPTPPISPGPGPGIN